MPRARYRLRPRLLRLTPRRRKAVTSRRGSVPARRAEAFDDVVLWDEREALPEIDLRRFDFVLLLDIVEHLKAPEVFLERLRRATRSTERRPTFIVTSGNVVFGICPCRRCWNFNYGKRGILDLTAHPTVYVRVARAAVHPVRLQRGTAGRIPRRSRRPSVSTGCRVRCSGSTAADSPVEGPVRLSDLSRRHAAIGGRAAGPVDRERAREGRGIHFGAR